MASTAEESGRGRDTAGGRFPRVVAVVVGVMFAGFGLWAFAAPATFYETLAVFEPYNRHFVRDIGAFQLGLGAVLLIAARVADGLAVALAGVAVGSAFHVTAHVLDAGIGGNPGTDIPFFAVVTVALVAAAVTRAAAVTPRD